MVLPFQLPPDDPNDPNNPVYVNPPPPPPPSPPIPPPPPPAPAPSGHEESYEPAPPTPSDAPAQNWADTFGSVFTPPPPPPPPTPQNYGTQGFQPFTPDYLPTQTQWSPGGVQPPTMPTYTPPDISQYVDMTPYMFNGGNMLDSGWFGDNQQQQYDNWKAEMTAAVQSGDVTKQNQLQAEWDAMQRAWTTYNIQKPLFQQYGADLTAYNAQFNQGVNDFSASVDPRGEGILGYGKESMPTPEMGYDPNGNITVRSDVAQQYGMQGNTLYQPQFANTPDIREAQLTQLYSGSPTPQYPERLPLHDIANQDMLYRQFQQAQTAWQDMISRPQRDEGMQEIGPPGQPNYVSPDRLGIPSNIGLGGLVSGVQGLAGQLLAPGITALSELAKFDIGAAKQGADLARNVPGMGHVLDLSEWNARTGLSLADRIFVQPGTNIANTELNSIIEAYHTPLLKELRNGSQTSAQQGLTQGQSFAQARQREAERQQEADQIRDRFSKDHPWAYMAATLPFDPWLYMDPVELGSAAFKTARFKLLQEMPLENILQPGELAQLAKFEPTVGDSIRMYRQSGGLLQEFKKLGISDELSVAAAKRLSATQFLDEISKGSKLDTLARGGAQIDQLGKRIGASDVDISRLRNALSRNQRVADLMAEHEELLTQPTSRLAARTGQSQTADAFEQMKQEGEALRDISDRMPPAPEVEAPQLTAVQLATRRQAAFAGVSPQDIEAYTSWDDATLRNALDSVRGLLRDSASPEDITRLTAQRDAMIAETQFRRDSKVLLSGPANPLEGTPIGALPRQPEAALAEYVPPEVTDKTINDLIRSRETRPGIVERGQRYGERPRYMTPSERWTAPTKKQLGFVNDLFSKKKVFSNAEMKAIWSGEVSSQDLSKMIDQRKGLLEPYDNFINNYDVNPTAPTHAEQQYAAADKVARDRLVAQMDSYLPTKGTTLGWGGWRQADAGAIKAAIKAGETNIMPVSDFLSALRTHLDILPERIRAWAEETLREVAPHIGADGKVSYTTTSGRFQKHMDDLMEMLNDPAALDISEVDDFHQLMHERVFGNRTVEARAERDVAANWALLKSDTEVQRVTKQVADWKGEVEKLKSEMDAPISDVSKKGKLRRIEELNGRIRQYDAKYAPNLRPPRPKANERIAARDAVQTQQAAAQGVELPPSPAVTEAFTGDRAAGENQDIFWKLGDVPPAADEPVLQQVTRPDGTTYTPISKELERELRKGHGRIPSGALVRDEFQTAQRHLDDVSLRLYRARDSVQTMNRAERLADPEELARRKGIVDQLQSEENAARRTLGKTRKYADTVDQFSFPEASRGGGALGFMGAPDAGVKEWAQEQIRKLPWGQNTRVTAKGVKVRVVDDLAIERVARREADNALSTRAMRNLPSDEPASFSAFRGGPDDIQKTGYNGLYFARDSGDAGDYQMRYGDRIGTGLHVVDINAKKVLNLSGKNFDAAFEEVRQLPGFDQIAEVTTRTVPGREGMSVPERFFQFPHEEEVNWLKSLGYDVVATNESHGTFIVLNPDIVKERAFIVSRETPEAKAYLNPATSRIGIADTPAEFSADLNLPAEVQGMMHWTESQGYRVLDKVRNTKPIIDPGADGWAKLDWSQHGSLYDRYIKDVYGFDKMPGIHSVNPLEATALSHQAHIAKTSDIISGHMRSQLSQAYEGWVKQGGEDPVAYIERYMEGLMDPTRSLEDVAQTNPFFVNSREGMEALRTFRNHPELLTNWKMGKYDPYMSLGWMQDFGLLPTAKDGKYGAEEMRQIDRFLTQKSKPRGMSDRAWRMQQNIQNTMYNGKPLSERWVNELRPQFRPGSEWFAGDPALNQRTLDAQQEVANAFEAKKALRPQHINASKAEARAVHQQTVDTAFADAQLLQRRIDEADHALSTHFAQLKGRRGNAAEVQLTATLKQTKADLILSRKAALADANALKAGLNDAVQQAGDRAALEIKQINQRIDDGKSALAEVKQRYSMTTQIDAKALDGLFFPEEALKPVDPIKMSEAMASDMAKMEAERIGFNPDHVPWGMKTMQSVKGNLVPVVMTMMPGYHLRNVTGNFVAQLLAATRSDMHVNPNLVGYDGKVVRAWDDIGNGIMPSDWMMSGIGTGTGSDVDVADHLLPKLITGSFQGDSKLIGVANNTPARLLQPIYKGGIKAGDVGERFTKKVLYTQEWGWSYADDWRKSVDAITSDPALRERLRNVMGHNQLTTAMEELALPAEMRTQLRAAQNGAISTADLKAYRTTAAALRDYRMRNRMDVLLDKFIPVHYWTTKNAAFVGKTVAHTPAIATAAMQAFDNLNLQNKDLPAALRTSLFKIPKEWIPFYDHDYYIRLTQLTNPAIFAAARLADPKKWDLSKTSLPDRTWAYSLLGVKNMWESLGLRIGPQWDLGIKAGNMAITESRRQGFDPRIFDYITRTANWASSPQGYRNSLLPFSNLAQTNTNVQRAMEGWSQLVYGSAYTRAETASFIREAADRWQHGDLSGGQYYVILQAINDKKFDYSDDYAAQLKKDNHDKTLTDAQIDEALHQVRDVIDGVIGDKATSWALSAAGVSGMMYPDERHNQDVANNLYSALRAMPQQRQSVFMAPINGAERVVGAALANLVKGTTQAEVHDFIRNTKNGYVAYEWLDKFAPWLPGYWAASDDQAKIKQVISDRNDRLDADAKYAKDKTYYANRSNVYQLEKNNRAVRAAQSDRNQPYWDSLNAEGQRYAQALVEAGDNPGKLLLAVSTHKAAMDKLGDPPEVIRANFPFQGPSYFEGAGPGQRDTVANDKRQVADYEKQAAQRGYLLDTVAQQMGLDPSDPKWRDEDGKFKGDEYRQAVEDAATDAPQVYAELYRDFQKEGIPMATGDLISHISSADFQYHLRDKQAWAGDLFTAMKDERTAIKAMPNGPERDAAIWQFDQTYGAYGEYNAPRDYGATEKFTSEDDARYNNGTNAIGSWYYNNATPKEKAEFKAAYPNAFDEDGKLITTQLHGDQVDQIVKDQGLNRTPELSQDPAASVSAKADAEDLAQTQHVYALRDDMKTNLTTSQADALDAIDTHTYSDKDMADRAYELKGALGLSWRKLAGYVKDHMGVSSDDAALLGWINDQAALTQVAIDSGAYDAREAWFNGLSAQDQQLLISEDPKSWYPGEDTTSGGGGGAGSGSSSSTYSGGGGGGSTFSGGGGGGGKSSTATSSGGTTGGATYLGSGTSRVAVPSWVQQLLSMPYLTTQQRTMLQNMLMAYFASGGTSQIPLAPPPGTRTKTRPGFPEAAG